MSKITITIEGEHRGGKSTIATLLYYALNNRHKIRTSLKNVDPIDAIPNLKNIKYQKGIEIEIIEVPSPIVQIDCRPKAV